MGMEALGIFVITVFAVIVQNILFKRLSDQAALRELRKETERLAAGQKEARKAGNAEKMNELLKKQSDLQMRRLSLTMKPNMMSSLVFIAAFWLIQANYTTVYLFNWDEIPGNGTGMFMDAINRSSGVDWIKTANIEKLDDGRTIRVFTEKNYLSLRLDDKKTKVNLKIDDGRNEEFIAKTEKGTLNVYAAVKIALPMAIPIPVFAFPPIAFTQTLGWFGWYLLIAITASLIVRDVLGIEI